MQEIVISLVAGILGGNAFAATFKKYSFGPFWNSFIGLLGGAVGRKVLQLIHISFENSSNIAVSIVSSALSGVLLAAIFGAVKKSVAKNTAVVRRSSLK
jgi:xanthosine utilization system XapX-like protein